MMDDPGVAAREGGFPRLDGNALAGTLEQAFGRDLTTTTAVCAHCGRAAELGAQLLYRAPGSPGAVLRCSACEGLLLVVVERAADCLVSMTGIVKLEL